MKIILIGKTATGKDTIANELCKRYGYKLAKSHTTRPKRENEGETHCFISEENYAKYSSEERLAETEVNGYHYFLHPSEVEESDIVIVDPYGLDALINYFEHDVFLVVRIKANKRDRKKAYKKRKSNISFAERTVAERERFENFNTCCELELQREFDATAENRIYHKKYRDVHPLCSCINDFDEYSLNEIVSDIRIIRGLFDEFKQTIIKEGKHDTIDTDIATAKIFLDPKLHQEYFIKSLQLKIRGENE